MERSVCPRFSEISTAEANQESPALKGALIALLSEHTENEAGKKVAPAGNDYRRVIAAEPERGMVIYAFVAYRSRQCSGPSARAMLFTFDQTNAHTGGRLVLNREIAAVAAEPLIRFDIKESLGKFGSRVTTIKCHGRLLCENAQEIKELVKPLIQARRRRIVIDCSDLQSLDSSGLGALVSLKVSAFNQGLVKLELVNLSPRVSELVKLTRLTDLFAS